MNTIELFDKDGRPAAAWMCGNCGLPWLDKDFADSCCTCGYCHEPLSPKANCHMACYEKAQREADEKRIVGAQKLPTWAGWVFHGEEFAESTKALAEKIEAKLESGELLLKDWPQWAFVCVPRHPDRVGTDVVVESIKDDMYEDFEFDLDGIAELREALEAFNDANEHLVTYEPDFTRVVAIPPYNRGKGDNP